MVKISKYSKYGEYAKTIEILSRLTKNKFKITPVDANYFDVDEFDADEIDADEFDEKFNEPKPKGITTNTTGMLMFFGFNRWEIKFVKGYEKVIPHEMCHVIDSVASLKQTALKKDFSEIAENYKQQYINRKTYRKPKLDIKTIKDIEYQTRNAECFARLLNNWAYETNLIDMPPTESSDGDTFASRYYMRNKDIIDDYFNTLFADEIADLIADGLVEESSKLTELAEANNLSL